MAELVVKESEIQQLLAAAEEWPHKYTKQILSFWQQVAQIRQQENVQAQELAKKAEEEKQNTLKLETKNSNEASNPGLNSETLSSS